MPYAPARPCAAARCAYRHPCPIHPTGWAAAIATRETKQARGYGGPWEKTLRPQVIARDGGMCQACGELGAIVDHVIPKARGGDDELDNLQLLCDRCNRTKTARESNRTR